MNKSHPKLFFELTKNFMNAEQLKELDVNAATFEKNKIMIINPI